MTLDRWTQSTCGSSAAGVVMISLNGFTAAGIAGEDVRENVRTNTGTANSANGIMLRNTGTADSCWSAAAPMIDRDPTAPGRTNPHIHNPAAVTISSSWFG